MTACTMTPEIASAAQLLFGCIVALIVLGVFMTGMEDKSEG